MNATAGGAVASQSREWRIVALFCLAGPPIALTMLIALVLAWPLDPDGLPGPTASGFLAAYPVLLIPAYLLGLPAAFAAGAGVVVLARKGRGEAWLTPLFVGGSVGAIWCALFFAVIVGDFSSLGRMPRLVVSMLAINMLTTVICWRLAQRWLRQTS